MKIKKMISNNKLCVCLFMGMLGAAMGMAAAKCVISACGCGSIRYKAKKALKAMEEKI